MSYLKEPFDGASPPKDPSKNPACSVLTRRGAMNAIEPRGRVITFYPYTGGTGRSMALANVGWILASHGKRVICIDWDLEAPGLHRYFSPVLIDAELYSTD